MKPTVILVIRRDDGFSELLRERGFEVENLELISAEPFEDQAELNARLKHLNEYDGLFFTSPVAAKVFVTAEKSFKGKIFALGQRAKNVLESAGFDVVFNETANTAAEMMANLDLEELAGKKLLFIRGNKSMRTVVELLDGKADVDEVVVYETRTVTPDEARLRDLRPRLNEGEIDWVCFFSPSGVNAFCDIFEKPGSKIAAIGETTAKKLTDAGLTADLISTKATAEAFADELTEVIKKH